MRPRSVPIRSSGLGTCPSRAVVRCRYVAVLSRRAWPSSNCTARTSAPVSSRCVAKLCRNVCGETVGDPSRQSRLGQHPAHGLAREVRVRLLLTSREKPRTAWPERAPVCPQSLEHPRAHHHVPRSGLALAHMEQHLDRQRPASQQAPRDQKECGHAAARHPPPDHPRHPPQGHRHRTHIRIPMIPPSAEAWVKHK